MPGLEKMHKQFNGVSDVNFYDIDDTPVKAKKAKKTFPPIKDHVLLSIATQLPKAAEEIKSKATESLIRDIVSTIPEEWLEEEGAALSVAEKQEAYTQFIYTRVQNIDSLTKEAEDARKASL